MERWPNFFIVGAPRAGTTSLWEYLKNTKGVYMSPIKQPKYFSVSVNDKIPLQRPIRKKQDYLKLFKDVKDEVAIGESTPSYLWDPQTPKLIHSVVPDAKIIMILRDPVERAFSHYLLTFGFGMEQSSFSDAIQKALKAPPDYSGRIIVAGFYSESIKRYLKYFTREQIKIIIFEEFIKDTISTVKDILEFLGVKAEVPEGIEKIHNPYTESNNPLITTLKRSNTARQLAKNFLPRMAGRKIKKFFDKEVPKPKFLEKDRTFLEKLYYNDVKELEKIIGRTVPWHIYKN